jgi:hypothetical protein
VDDEVGDREDKAEEEPPAHEPVADDRHRANGHADDRQAGHEMPRRMSDHDAEILLHVF